MPRTETQAGRDRCCLRRLVWAPLQPAKNPRAGRLEPKYHATRHLNFTSRTLICRVQLYLRRFQNTPRQPPPKKMPEPRTKPKSYQPPELNTS